MPAAPRYAKRLLYAALALALLAAATLFALTALVREPGGARLSALISEQLPGATMRYADADLHFSLSGAHLSARNLTLSIGGHHLVSEDADFWLEDDRFKLELDAPTLWLRDLAGADNNDTPPTLPLPTEIVLSDARIIMATPAITLTGVDAIARASSSGWTLRLQDGNDHLRLRLQQNERLHLHAELDNPPLPPALAPPVAWRAARMTIAADIGDTIHYRAGGVFDTLTDNAENITARVATWKSAGVWTSAAAMTLTVALTAGDIRTTLATVQAATLAAILKLQDNNWTAQRGRLKINDPALTLQTDFNAFAALKPDCAAALPRCITDSAVQFDTLGAATLPYAPSITVTAGGEGFWRQTSSGWRLTADSLHVAGADGTVAATLAIDASATLTTFAAHGGAGAISITAIARYLPQDDVRQWLVESLAAGSVPQAAFTLHGDTRPGNATLHVDAAFTNGILNIADGWQPAQHLSGLFRLQHDAIIITGGGVFDGITVPAITARIPDLFGERNTLFLNLRGAPAALTDHLAAARRAPATRAAMQAADDALTIEGGRGELALAATVPLAQPDNTRARARLDVRHGALRAGALPTYSGVSGNVQFDNDSVRGVLRGKVPGMALDDPHLLAAFDATALTLRGTVAAAVLLGVAGIDDAPISGSTPFAISRTASLTLFSATLDGSVIDLPYPLGKGARETVALELQMADGAIDGQFANRHITINVRGNADGGADIAINTAAAAPPASGINLHGAADGVNLDLWLGESGGGDNHFAAIHLTLNNSDIMGVVSERFAVRGGGGGDTPLSVRVDSDLAAGDLVFADRALRAAFSHLIIPLGSDNIGKDSGQIASLTVNVVASTLIVSGLTLGAMTLAGAPAPSQRSNDTRWALSTLHVISEQITLHMGGVFEREHTILSVRLQTDSLPALMTVLQIPPVFGRGDLRLFGSIGWPGTPIDFQSPALRGDLRLEAREVQYLDTDFDTDVVNLLAIFSPQSLFSLGFTELGKGGGIIFDDITGQLSLADGAARFTDPIHMTSRDLSIDIQGSTDFVQRQHDLYGKVRPGKKLLSAGSTTGLGAGLLVLNPTSLAAAALLGKIFEKPIASIGSYDYTITGTWQDPEYKEVGITDTTPDNAATDN